MANENSLVRVGKVSAVDPGRLRARVFYPGMHNMVSDWLPVIQFPAMNTNVVVNHQHTAATWMPGVNDTVLVIMEYGFNSGGYIAGVIP